MNKRDKLELFFYQHIAHRVLLILVAAFFALAIPFLMVVVMIISILDPDRGNAYFHGIWARLGE
ncbi:MAG: hypothetical protein ACRCTP_17930 [Aeromonas popoffii]|uniref:hypothetical protein n=1 Tax=Aeromonas popoffii TaxID=70856 RepID=UPI003F3637D1